MKACLLLEGHFWHSLTSGPLVRWGLKAIWEWPASPFFQLKQCPLGSPSPPCALPSFCWKHWGLLQLKLRLYLEHLLHCCCLVAKLCPTPCDPMDCSPPGSSVNGIPQVRILEGVAICFSKGYSQPRDRTHVSCIGRQVLYHWANREASENARISQQHSWSFWCLLECQWSVCHTYPSRLCRANGEAVKVKHNLSENSSPVPASGIYICGATWQKHDFAWGPRMPPIL